MSKRAQAKDATQVLRVTQLAVLELIDGWLCHQDDWRAFRKAVSFQPTAFARDMSSALQHGLLLGLGLPFAFGIATIIQGAVQISPPLGVSLRAAHLKVAAMVTTLEDSAQRRGTRI